MKNTLNWLYGMISAAIGAAANAIPLMIVDPLTFNLDQGLGKVLTVALTSAIVAVCFYLKQSPLPPKDCAEK
jgi:hypothetical protein